MIRNFRRKKAKVDEFQITTSVSALTIECVNEMWYPNSLSIVWDKSNPKHSSTKPVPWQPGFKNPNRGIHVWPEPDPLQVKLTLLKNSKNELLCYQERPWKILVQNVSASGRRKVILAGNIDIADYITEEPRSCDVTVTLKPMTKNVVSGSLEFTLSSVILEDGLPRRTDKEIFDEFMKDAIEWRKKSLHEAKNSLQEEGSKSSVKKSSGHKAPVSDTSAEEKRIDKSQFGADNKLNDHQEAAFCCNNNKEPMEIKRKASSPTSFAKSSSDPPLPRLTGPSPQNKKTAVASNDQLKCDVREVKREKNCLSSIVSHSSNEKTSKYVIGQEPGNQIRDQSSSSRRKRNRRRKKASKIPKWLNPFGKQSNDGQSSLSSESESNPCKERPEKHFGSGKCKNRDEGDGKEKVVNNGSAIVPKNDSSDVGEGGAVANGEELSTRKKGNDVLCSTLVAPVLKRAKPCVAVSVGEYEENKGEESDGYRSSIDLGTSPSYGSTLDKARPTPFVETSFSVKESPVNQEAVSVVSQHFPELSQYVKEQIYLLKEEIACLEKVSVKLETEMKLAMKTKDCEEELGGLTQDWISLTKHKGEMIIRKQDLEILDKQNNLNECSCVILNELKYLFEVEDPVQLLLASNLSDGKQYSV
ncbi:hypothetical protein ACROYT_G025700 [Oculina patagonica]